MMSTPVQHHEAAPNPRRAWIVVGMLVVLMMINFFDKAVMGLAARPMITDLGLTLEQYGLASSSFFFLFFVAALLGGFVANRVNTRWLLLLIAVLWGLAQLSMLAASGLTVIIASRMLLGTAEGPTFPLVNHASYKWLKDSDRSLASSLLAGGASLGVLLGTPLITYVVVTHGWRAAFVVSAVVTLAWCVLWLAIGREGPLTGSSTETATAGPTTTARLEGLRTSYRRTFLSGTFAASALAGFAVYWAVALDLLFAPIYLETVVGLSLTEVGTFIVVKQVFTILVVYIGLGYVVKRLIARGVSSRYARGMLGGISVLLGGLATIGFVVVPGTEIKLVLNVLSNLAVVTLAISQTVCAEITPTKQRGGVLGTYAAIYALSGVIAPLITGRLTTSLGPIEGLRTAWLILGGLLLVGGLAAALFVRPARDAERIAEHARRADTAPAGRTFDSTHV